MHKKQQLSDLGTKEDVIEVYFKFEGKKLEDILDWNFQMMSEDGRAYQPTSKAIAGDTLKLVFSNIDLNNKCYEFQIPSQPVTD